MPIFLATFPLGLTNPDHALSSRTPPPPAFSPALPKCDPLFICPWSAPPCCSSPRPTLTQGISTLRFCVCWGVLESICLLMWQRGTWTARPSCHEAWLSPPQYPSPPNPPGLWSLGSSPGSMICGLKLQMRLWWVVFVYEAPEKIRSLGPRGPYVKGRGEGRTPEGQCGHPSTQIGSRHSLESSFKLFNHLFDPMSNVRRQLLGDRM